MGSPVGRRAGITVSDWILEMLQRPRVEELPQQRALPLRTEQSVVASLAENGEDVARACLPQEGRIPLPKVELGRQLFRLHAGGDEDFLHRLPVERAWAVVDQSVGQGRDGVDHLLEIANQVDR